VKNEEVVIQKNTAPVRCFHLTASFLSGEKHLTSARFFNFLCGKPSEMANNDRKYIPIFVAPRCGAIFYVFFFYLY